MCAEGPVNITHDKGHNHHKTSSVQAYRADLDREMAYRLSLLPDLSSFVEVTGLISSGYSNGV